MIGFPDFEKIFYRIPEYTSIAEDIWIWFMSSISPFPPGNYGPYTLYTVPTGYKAILADVGAGAQFQGIATFYISDGDNIARIYYGDYGTRTHAFVLPACALPGQIIVYELSNEDIITGHFRFFLTMWRIPGSSPENPKSNDPAERFRVGDFSSCEQLLLPNNETLYLFHKRGEKEENYLKIKDYGLKNQKILKSFHLTEEEKREIFTINSQNFSKVLSKIENKHKK